MSAIKDLAIAGGFDKDDDFVFGGPVGEYMNQANRVISEAVKKIAGNDENEGVIINTLVERN